MQLISTAAPGSHPHSLYGKEQFGHSAKYLILSGIKKRSHTGLKIHEGE